MRVIRRPRWALALPLACLAAALAPTPAQAAPSATFATGVRLVDQPAGRPWAIRLRLAGEFADPDGIDAQPVLQRLIFRMPDATVNAAGVPICDREPIVSVASRYDPCPPRLAVGAGTSDVQLRRPLGIDLHGHAPFYRYHLRTALYVGPRAPGGRVLLVIGSGVNSPLTVVMRGLLRHVAGGWVYDLPIPVVRDPEIGVMKVERFTMSVGGWNRARPRRWFVEAPRSCPDAGFAFSMESQFEGVAPLLASRGIGCELLGR